MSHCLIFLRHQSMEGEKRSILELSDAETREVTDPAASVTRLSEMNCECRDALRASHDSTVVDAARRWAN